MYVTVKVTFHLRSLIPTYCTTHQQ